MFCYIYSLILNFYYYETEIQPIIFFCIFDKDALDKQVSAKNCRIAKRD